MRATGTGGTDEASNVGRAVKRFARQLARLFKQQRGRCYYCGGDTWMRSEGMESAKDRLNIPEGKHGLKMAHDAMATREHLKRVMDGGQNHIDNLVMACQACNSRRVDTPTEAHRMDMRVLVAAGLHPTNRPPVIDSAQEHRKRGLAALKKLRQEGAL